MSDDYEESKEETIWGSPEEPITWEYPIPTDLEKVIPNPGVARWNVAPSRENPNPNPNPPKKTVLKQHVDFFDLNNDGVVQPWETWVASGMMGFNWFECVLAVILVNVVFTYRTQESWWPSLTGKLVIKNVHRLVHGSPTSVIDTEGRFVPQKFEEIFTKFDKDGKGYLTFFDVCSMVKHNMRLLDFAGCIIAVLEWVFLWLLLGNGYWINGRITKKELRALYDGSLFHKSAQKRAIWLAKNKPSSDWRKEAHPVIN